MSWKGLEMRRGRNAVWGETTKLVFESWKRRMDLGGHATFAFELMHYESGSNGVLGR